METLEAVLNLGDGAMGAVAMEAEDSDAAWAEARSRFPGFRLAPVAREMVDAPEMD